MGWIIKLRHETGTPRIETIGVFDTEGQARKVAQELFPTDKPGLTIERGNKAMYTPQAMYDYLKARY